MPVIFYVRIQSELAKTIPGAYEATNVRREVYEVLYPLKPERGPL